MPIENEHPDAVDIDTAGEEELALFCKALGHPARIRILKHLLRENRCFCGRIVEILPLAQSTVSQHLKILKECGLVLGEVEGPKTCYCIDRKKLASVRNALTILSAGRED
jgi:DNA-binding transcriptional ArsR family regulator